MPVLKRAWQKGDTVWKTTTLSWLLQETLSELESIKEDIMVVRERGRQIMEVSDAEGSKAMEATLTMLSDRITSLQTLADHKGKQLQVGVS